ESFLEIKNMPFEQARSYLARFLFQGDDVFREVGACSGGEKSRLALARLLVTEPNLLVLDEPTTHFDIPSREALEQVLLGYPGTILLVSHDRHLVSLLAESLLVAADGEVNVFPGTFEEWSQAQRESEAIAAAARVKEKAKPAPRPQPVRSQGPKRRNPAAPVVDMEQVIVELEDRLGNIAEKLQEATLGQDVDEMSRLAEEHVRTQAELERKLEAWEE
ncbi:MAG: ABC-F family ATP-binding cassette domain-containing protein, partial [Chloroflexi bacterium]|nr:ABC-F family ATP-binding cassette domain-containing protein [Chloroflexota bacterium]